MISDLEKKDSETAAVFSLAWGASNDLYIVRPVRPKYCTGKKSLNPMKFQTSAQWENAGSSTKQIEPRPAARP